MSSPITFSGFNNIDFNTVLNALMLQASQPLTVLQNRQNALRSQVDSLTTLSSNVSSLRSAADSLGNLSSISTMAGMSSDSAVSATTTSGAVSGHHEVVVTELAHAQVTATTSTAPDATTTVVASGGTLTIGGKAVTLAGDVTLQGLAGAINNTPDTGVTASAVRTGAASYKLVLTSTVTGEAGAFTITNTLTGGLGVTFGDADHDGVSGDSAADNAVVATDAAILLNNVAVTSASNTFEDVMPGVTLTVSRKDPDKTIAIDIAPDSSALARKVDAFISAYNNVIKFVDAQRASAANGDPGSLGRDPFLRQLRTAVRNELIGAHGSSAVTHLAEVGIEFTSTGTIQLNQAVFDDAVANHGDDVRALFAGPDGVFPAVTTLLESYSTSSGLISGMKDRLTRQVAAMDDQITTMQSRLALQKAALQREFTEADAAMSRLKNQSGSLSNLGSGLGSL